MGDSEFLISGSTSFVVDADHEVFGSGAAITIFYERNTDVLECVENDALDGENMGLSESTIDLVRETVPIERLSSTLIVNRFSAACKQNRGTRLTWNSRRFRTVPFTSNIISDPSIQRP